ncbi:hypothetical protein Tco_0024700 [Tanacetum coccineum]
MEELIVHVSEKTYAYGAIRAENQNLLSTISELKTRLEKVEKGKSVNTKFDKTNGSQSLLCVTPLNKHAFQKKTDVPKIEENHVVSKPVTLQTSPTKQTGANQNTNESLTRNVVQIVLWVVDSGCLKHMIVIWMRTQLLDYVYKYNRIPMYCDSKSAIAISCNPVQHSKTKHIDIRYHFIKEHVEKGTVIYQGTTTDMQLMVHPDELCPPNKRNDLMEANKKVDLEHVQCLPESKILTNIIKNHPLRFSIAASSSVPWIYMAQFWHTLKEDGSKYRLKFMLDKKELTLTLDDFRTIFHLPQATDNNHNSFVPPPSFSDMVPFYKQVLGFTMELKTSSSFKTTGLLQPWQTLCKIFSKCLTTRVTGWDQPPLQIMQMMYCFVNNIHVDYAELL